jgi:hypothetical protein
MPYSPATLPLPLHPLATAVLATFCLLPVEALAVQVVTNCNDAGAGSLRQAVKDAASGELVDATTLACSKITLTTGYILVGQNSLKIDGPGADKLVIDGLNDPAGHYPIFYDPIAGQLEIDHVTVSHGDFYLNSDTKYTGGGCIFSRGNLVLTGTTVSNCSMTAGPKSHARGGAIFADGDVTLQQSLVTGNSTHGASPFGYEMNTYSGGVFSRYGTIKLDHSTISNNHAINGGGIYSKVTVGVYYSTISGNDAIVGGGIDCLCGLRISHSTVSGNRAAYSGGLRLSPPTTAQVKSTYITSSTFSGNTSTSAGSGAAMEIGVPITISYSTIAFNRAPVNGTVGALYWYNGTASANAMNLVSTIVAENYPFDVDSDTAVTGGKNLVTSSPATLPGDTIKNTCPRLEPLAGNGGPTPTHALRHTSPAIDKGYPLVNATTDQRGTGFPRSFGTSTDIGASEWLGAPVDDDIFHGGFDFNPDATNCDL